MVHVTHSKTCHFLSAQGAASSPPLPVPVGDPAVVVESGPVVYDEAAADEEDEEDEEACVSAMDLLGSNGQSPLPVPPPPARRSCSYGEVAFINPAPSPRPRLRLRRRLR